MDQSPTQQVQHVQHVQQVLDILEKTDLVDALTYVGLWSRIFSHI